MQSVLFKAQGRLRNYLLLDTGVLRELVSKDVINDEERQQIENEPIRERQVSNHGDHSDGVSVKDGINYRCEKMLVIRKTCFLLKKTVGVRDRAPPYKHGKRLLRDHF